jgi:hypothetical protein
MHKGDAESAGGTPLGEQRTQVRYPVVTSTIYKFSNVVLLYLNQTEMYNIWFVLQDTLVQHPLPLNCHALHV